MELEQVAEKIRRTLEVALGSAPDEMGDVHVYRLGEIQVYVGCDSMRNLVALFPKSENSLSLVSGSLGYSSNESLIWSDKPSDVNEVSVLKYSQSSQSDIEYFSEATASLCKCLESGMSGDELARVVESWFGLLLAAKEPTYSEILGLWGELFVIRSSKNPRMALTSWQWKDNDPLDFVYRGCALEVKCTTGSAREHSTSLTQNAATGVLRTVVVSIVTSDRADGESLNDIYSEILDAVSDDSILTSKIVSAVARRTLFSSLIRDLRFSSSDAKQSLLYFKWADLPHPVLNQRITGANWTFLPDVTLGMDRQLLVTASVELADVF